MKAIVIAVIVGVLLFGAVWVATARWAKRSWGTVTVEPGVAQEYQLERQRP